MERMGKFVISDSDFSSSSIEKEAPGYNSNGSEESQTSPESVNNNDLSSDENSSQDKVVGRAEVVEVGGHRGRVAEASRRLEALENSSVEIDFLSVRGF